MGGASPPGGTAERAAITVEKADPVLLGEERLPPPAATPRSNLAARVDSPRSPQPGRVTPRPSLSGPELRPIPRTPGANRRLSAEGAPAAPRPGTGIVYPMSGQDEGAPPPGLSPLQQPPGAVHLSPRMTAIFGGLFGLAIVTSLIALLIQGVPPRNERAIIAGSAAASGASSADAPPSRAEAAPKKRVRVAVPGPWRLSELEKEPGITTFRGTMDRKSLFEVLGDKGVAKSEVYRIVKALDGIRKLDKSHRKDRYAVALTGKKVKGFEYEVSPSEIYQAREGDGGLLTGSKLDMKLAEEEYVGAFYVGGDVAASAKAAGFEDGITGALDDALAGHLSTEAFDEGGVVRAIVVEETALGLFSRYKRVTAMEYRPADPAGKPTRIYAFNGQEARGYWNERGRQPSSGGWRSPVPGAMVSSPFNPHRMHPVLHKLMPHTGTDLGASTGTPIYAAYRGVIESAGNLGPCGNAVVIAHSGGITTGYCHMSRFAAGIKPGDKVGTRQLIGYVGQTGRATGPHLHFFAKKNGVFFDAMTLHLDGDRPVPAGDRGAFLAAKAELDRRLDAIPLPEPPPPPEPDKVVTAAVGSAAVEPGDAPSGKDKDKEPKESKGGSAPKRSAMQVGSPEALAAARAEPGIHPSQLVEDKGEDDDDGAVPPGTTPAPKPSAKGKGKPDPSDDEEDEK